MKKKLIQEQREKAIIESFNKTFNKIKRSNEPKLIKENDEGLIEYDVPEWAVSPLINGDDSGLKPEDINKLENFVRDIIKTHGNANFLLGDMDGKDKLGFQRDNDIDNLGSNVYRLYLRPSNPEDESIDEINIKKGIAGLGLAAALAGSPQSSIAQSITPTKDIKTTVSTVDRQSDEGAAQDLLKSFRENPFTADMWSKKNPANKKLFRRIKELNDDYMEYGIIEPKELKMFGAMYKNTPIATSFLQRENQ